MKGQAEQKRTRLPWLRAGVQAVCLGLFVYLALAAPFQWSWPLPSDLFFRFDPLVWLVVSTAARQVALYGSFVLLLVVATALFGRVFCGWICPLGTTIDTVRWVRGRRPVGSWVRRLWSLRFWVLILVLGGAAAGVNFTRWLDPLVISSRAIHTAHNPSLDWAAAAVGWMLLGMVIGLAFLAPRFWCRTLCPLGAVFSLVARPAPVRRRATESCTQCGTCSAACPMGQSQLEHSPTRCIGCRRCQGACPEQAIRFMPNLRLMRAGLPSDFPKPTGLWRRRFLLGLGSLTAGGVVGILLRARSIQAPLRPPGSPGEEKFVARCVGCGTCLSVCPTGGLLPLVSAHRIDAAFTPMLVPRTGPCLPDCTACGEACPTGAIERITAENKAAIQIGIAVLDRSRCLPWARGERCVICLDVCPPSYNAIELKPTPAGPFLPQVKDAACTGCGLCEHRCPLDGESAIRVVA